MYAGRWCPRAEVEVAVPVEVEVEEQIARHDLCLAHFMAILLVIY